MHPLNDPSVMGGLMPPMPTLRRSEKRIERNPDDDPRRPLQMLVLTIPLCVLVAGGLVWGLWWVAGMVG